MDLQNSFSNLILVLLGLQTFSLQTFLYNFFISKTFSFQKTFFWFFYILRFAGSSNSFSNLILVLLDLQTFSLQTFSF
jgi:hypothetical protein